MSGRVDKKRDGEEQKKARAANQATHNKWRDQQKPLPPGDGVFAGLFMEEDDNGNVEFEDLDNGFQQIEGDDLLDMNEALGLEDANPLQVEPIEAGGEDMPADMPAVAPEEVVVEGVQPGVQPGAFGVGELPGAANDAE